MTLDAFGHPIDFGTKLVIGKRRRDGKYLVAFIFKSTGITVRNVLTREQLDAEVTKERTLRGVDCEIVGYPSR